MDRLIISVLGETDHINSAHTAGEDEGTAQNRIRLSFVQGSFTEEFDVHVSDENFGYAAVLFSVVALMIFLLVGALLWTQRDASCEHDGTATDEPGGQNEKQVHEACIIIAGEQKLRIFLHNSKTPLLWIPGRIGAVLLLWLALCTLQELDGHNFKSKEKDAFSRLLARGIIAICIFTLPFPTTIEVVEYLQKLSASERRDFVDSVRKRLSLDDSGESSENSFAVLSEYRGGLLVYHILCWCTSKVMESGSPFSDTSVNYSLKAGYSIIHSDPNNILAMLHKDPSFCYGAIR